MQHQERLRRAVGRAAPKFTSKLGRGPQSKEYVHCLCFSEKLFSCDTNASNSHDRGLEAPLLQILHEPIGQAIGLRVSANCIPSAQGLGHY